MGAELNLWVTPFFITGIGSYEPGPIYPYSSSASCNTSIPGANYSYALAVDCFGIDGIELILISCSAEYKDLGAIILKPLEEGLDGL